MVCDALVDILLQCIVYDSDPVIQKDDGTAKKSEHTSGEVEVKETLGNKEKGPKRKDEKKSEHCPCLSYPPYNALCMHL